MVKKLPANSGDVGFISGSGRPPEEGKGNPLQYSSLGNPTDRGAWRVLVHGDAKSQVQLSNEHTHAHRGVCLTAVKMIIVFF